MTTDWFTRLFPDQPPQRLGDFTTTPRLIPISVVALGVGVLAAFVSQGLTMLIGLFTHLFFFQTFDTTLVSPAGHTLGPVAVLVPVVGALMVGLIARYGSERIRGHGIPEALESILTRGSHVEPKVAVLKPLSAAISIGSGGPFGAEGPIIMTGGALGSLIAQGFHLTSAERKTLLVAGAAGGMAATFGSPLAAIMLAVELLLFEWKPRSFVPVALASIAAMSTREMLLGNTGPLLQVPAHSHAGVMVLGACMLAGLAAGLLSVLMTGSVYFFEDFFIEKLKRIHWMWWPALGGLGIGLGGLLCPQALGVGYEVIGELLQGHMALKAVLLLITVKWFIWALALGSGTSGGVLAPLLMMGAALGSLEAPVLPPMGDGFWPLISMGAILAGAMRSPLTGMLFALEITHDWGSVMPLAVAVVTAHAFTVLVLRRSILTEKVSRRGYHVTREYEIDPLEVLFARDVMREAAADAQAAVTAFADETLRSLAYRMASSGETELGVVQRDAPNVVVGRISLADLLRARKRHLEQETRRERQYPIYLLFTPWLRKKTEPSSA
ncbi:MAG: chloride channel protein [Myxococcaceae bacterium]|nr:chloride channel protein [Myxococcaceae bacterium]